MTKYAYYQCHKCDKAYFGGEAQCQVQITTDLSSPCTTLCLNTFQPRWRWRWKPTLGTPLVDLLALHTLTSQADAGDEFNPEDLVCGGCSNLSQEVCPKHGTDYLEYKCRLVRDNLGTPYLIHLYARLG